MSNQACSVKEHLRLKQEELSPKLLKLAKYIEANYQDVPFLGARALAEKAGVSEATVTRLAYACTYDGYSEFQAALKAELKEKLSLRRHVPSKKKSLFMEVMSMEKDIFNEMERLIDKNAFNQAVDMMYKAPQLLVVGTHSNVMMAEYAAYYLCGFKKNVHLVRELGNHSYSFAKSMPENTVTLAFSFPRYPRQTRAILSDFKDAGSKIISITDSTLSPVAAMSDLIFTVPLKYLSYIDSYGAVMALTHALMLGVLHKDDKARKTYLSSYNDFLTSKDLFIDTEIDIVDLSSQSLDG